MTSAARITIGMAILIIAILELPRTDIGAAASPRAAQDSDTLPPGAAARLGWSPLRIGDAAFAFTPDSRTIVVVTQQGNLRRLAAQTGRLLERRQLSDRSDVDPVRRSSAELSANGQSAALYEWSYSGARVTVYDVVSGKRIFRRASTERRQIQFSSGLSSDGKQLALVENEDAPKETVIEDETTPKRTCIRLIDLKSGRMREVGTFQQVMLQVWFSEDGKRLIAAHQDVAQNNSIYVLGQPAPHVITAFDLPSEKKLWRRTIWAMNFAVSRDGSMVLATGCPKSNGWNMPGFGSSSICPAVGFHVLQMDAEAKKLTKFFMHCGLDSDHFPNPLNRASFALAPDDRTIVINLFDAHGAAYIVSWDLRARKEIRRFKLPQTNSVQLTPIPMAVSADGRTLLTAGDYLQRWDLATGKPFFNPPPENGLPGSILQLSFTPNGKEVFASSLGGVSGRWNVAAGKRIDLIRNHYGGYPFIRTRNGLRTILPGESLTDGRLGVAILDPITGKEMRALRNPTPNEEFGDCALTANGKTLLALKSGKNSSQVTSWEVASGRKLSHFTRSRSSALPKSPFSPCGRWVLLDGKLFHVGSGTESFAPSALPGERMVCDDNSGQRRVWFSEDGRLLAAHLRKKEETSAAEDVLAVWELASGKVLARFAKAGFVAQAAFAPDGRTVALLDAQGVRMEDLLNGKQLAMYPAPDAMPGAADFAPDGSLLATGHHDGSIVLWKGMRSHSADPMALADGEADKLWADLSNASPALARAAIERLAHHPDAATLLAKRFRPPPTDAKLAAFINDLDSDTFAKREEAARQIRSYGAKAEPALRRTLTRAPSLEMRRRIENLLAEMAPPPLRLPLSGDHLRGVRAIEVLERAGNAAARSLLQAWAEQTQDVHLAIEARLAMERLGPIRAK
jgi:WD40 repeat protein